MGIVYKARHIAEPAGRLKMIIAGWFAGEEDLQGFWREAETLPSITRNIVRVYESASTMAVRSFRSNTWGGTGRPPSRRAVLLTRARKVFASAVARPTRPTTRHHPSRFETDEHPAWQVGEQHGFGGMKATHAA